ncbi:MAG TPA: hypothetical protein VH374_14760 [Polyangia bacterium]|nr:hypothetical protein [Polyangia bacterium]
MTIVGLPAAMNCSILAIAMLLAWPVAVLGQDAGAAHPKGGAGDRSEDARKSIDPNEIRLLVSSVICASRVDRQVDIDEIVSQDSGSRIAVLRAEVVRIDGDVGRLLKDLKSRSSQPLACSAPDVQRLVICIALKGLLRDDYCANPEMESEIDAATNIDEIWRGSKATLEAAEPLAEVGRDQSVKQKRTNDSLETVIDEILRGSKVTLEASEPLAEEPHKQERPTFRVGDLALTPRGFRAGAGGQMCYADFEVQAKRRIGFAGVHAFAVDAKGDVVYHSMELLPRGLAAGGTTMIEFSFTVPCEAINGMRFKL